ncbi:conserved hypothetical protein [Hyphomicrobiales bacterium]|jgi:hypothetical protein|nr:conserved hypothetical protein [Hyphomicrobiales bacterium]CAH1702332.1 conserved hypothetical protein [Hyphomicrobiales bacterium]CAI0346533.1 conserved hypothetical protein [Hyphomicrobiales bacterium]
MTTELDTSIRNAAALILDPDLQGSVLVVCVDKIPEDLGAPPLYTGIGRDSDGVYLEVGRGSDGAFLEGTDGIRRLTSVDAELLDLAIELSPEAAVLKEMSFETGASREYPVSFIGDFAPTPGF